MSIQTIKQYKKVTEVLWNWYQDSKDTLANSSNWDTAFGWGDHSAAGYLTDAPSDGSQYARIDGGWAEVAAGGTPAITDNQVVVGTGVGIEGDANLTIASDADTMAIVLGSDDTIQGGITLYGNATSGGGFVNFFNSTSNDTNANHYVVIADTNFKIGKSGGDSYAFEIDDLNLGLTAPSSTIADIDANGIKALITKEYADANYSGGDVTKVGTPVDNQIGVWTGDGTIEGDANLTWAGNVLLVKTNEFENQTTPTTGIIVENTDADFGGIKKTIISGVVISMEGINAESNITDTFLEFISTSQGRLVMRNNSIEHFNPTNNAFSTAFNWETPTSVTKTLTIPHKEGILAVTSEIPTVYDGYALSGTDSIPENKLRVESDRVVGPKTYTSVRASLKTADTTSNVTIDVKKNGVSIFDTLLTIDATETTSTTATTAFDFTASATSVTFNDDDEISFDVSNVTDAIGLKIKMI